MQSYTKHPKITIEQTVSSIELKPGEHIDIEMINKNHNNLGMVRVCLTDNNKMVIFSCDENSSQENVVNKKWEGHRSFRQTIDDIEDME